MKFSVPVIYTTTGWVLIEADNLEEAQAKANRMNKDGIEYFSIKDASSESEVMADEVEQL